MFDETIDHLLGLLPNTNLICIDLNGHGKSTMCRKSFTLWDQGNDVVTLMVCPPCTVRSFQICNFYKVHVEKATHMQTQDELQIQKAIFAGVSMGAGIALHIALSHPSRITALILMGSTADATTAEATAAISQVRDIWVSTPSPSEEIMDIAIRGWGGDPDVKGPRAQRIKRYWAERHSGAENVDPVLQSIEQREFLFPRLHEITAPVLLVHGEKDETWKLEGMLHIRDALVNTQVKTYVVKDSGHLVIHMRDSEDVSQVMVKFIDEVLPQDS